MLRNVELTFANGHTIRTQMNGDTATLVRYWLGTWSDVGTYPNEDMQPCVAIRVENQVHRMGPVLVGKIVSDNRKHDWTLKASAV